MCDDSNAVSGDGCSSDCREIEAGFACPPPDASSSSGAAAAGPCTPICGDGLRRGSEGCDDGNAEPGDGCSATCAVEHDGYCSCGTPGTACVCFDAGTDAMGYYTGWEGANISRERDVLA